MFLGKYAEEFIEILKDFFVEKILFLGFRGPLGYIATLFFVSHISGTNKLFSKNCGDLKFKIFLTRFPKFYNVISKKSALFLDQVVT